MNQFTIVWRALLLILSWTVFFSFPECDLQLSQKSNMVRNFIEKRCQKRDAKLQKLTCMFCGTEGFSDGYKTAEHVLSPGCWERIRANRGSGLKRKLLFPTRKSYNIKRDTYEGCQLPFRAKQRRVNLICEDEIGDAQSE